MDLKDPRKQRIILAVLFFIGLIYVYFVYDYTPKSREINNRTIHLIGLEQHIKSARAKIQASDEAQLRQDLQILETELERVKELLPLEEEVPYLLRDVERNGIQSGVNSVLFEPRGGLPAELYTRYSYRRCHGRGYGCFDE